MAKINNNQYYKSFSMSKLSTLAILGVTLLQNSMSMAAYNRVGQGVVRVDLKKQWVPHVEITDLEESE